MCVCATYLCSVASVSIDVRCVRYHDMSVLTKKKDRSAKPLCVLYYYTCVLYYMCAVVLLGRTTHQVC